jgi:hypothetical protein
MIVMVDSIVKRISKWPGLKALFIMAALVAGLGWIGTSPAAACKCEKPKEAREELAVSTAVFAGKVIKIEGNQVQFDVATLWKGPRQKRITVVNELSDCMFSFKEGEEYVVYTNGTESNPATSVCTRTIGVRQASDEVQALGTPLWNPAGAEMNSVETEQDLSAWYIGLGIVLLVLMIYLVYTMLRKKQVK